MAGTKRELLPSDVLPELTLEPDVEKFTFDGVVKITCDVQAWRTYKQMSQTIPCYQTITIVIIRTKKC